MTPEERSLLERTASLTEENNKILLSIRRSSRISLALRVMYWVVIILVSFGTFYFIQPYVETMTNLLNGGANNDGAVQSQSSTSLLKSLLQ